MRKKHTALLHKRHNISNVLIITLYIFKILIIFCRRITSVLLPLFNLVLDIFGIYEPAKEKRVCRDYKIEGGHTQVYLIFIHPLNIGVPCGSSFHFSSFYILCDLLQLQRLNKICKPQVPSKIKSENPPISNL